MRRRDFVLIPAGISLLVYDSLKWTVPSFDVSLLDQIMLVFWSIPSLITFGFDHG